MPALSEAGCGVAAAEFPEGGIPGCAVPIAGCGAGGHEPATNDFTEEAVREEAFAIGAGEFLRLKDATSFILKSLEGSKGSCEFFVWFDHDVRSGTPNFVVLLHVYHVVVLRVNDAVLLRVIDVVTLRVNDANILI